MFADFECPECGKVFIDVWIAHYNDVCKCSCGEDMEKRIASPAFKVEGWNAANGYSDD